MKKFRKSLTAASFLVVLAVVTALMASPTASAKLAEQIRSGIASVFGPSAQPAPVFADEDLVSGLRAFHFLEPLAPRSGDPTKFDASLLNYLRVDVCQVNPDNCSVVKTFTAQSATSEQIRIEKNGGWTYYIANWDTSRFNLNNKTYRVRVILADLQLGSIDLAPNVYNTFGRTWPIKFMIEKDPTIRVRLLRSLHKSASQVVSMLHSEFGLCGDQAAAFLANDLDPFSSSEISVAIQGVCQDVIVPFTTKISDEDTRNSLMTYDPSTGIMFFAVDTPVLRSLNVGDVLVSEPSAAAPYGFLRKITSIRKNRGQYTLETIQAKLTEAISRGTLTATGELLPGNIASANASLYGADQTKNDTSTKGQNAIDIGENFNFHRDIDTTIELSGSDSGASGSGTVHITGAVDFNAGYDLGIGIDTTLGIPTNVDRIEAHMDIDQKSTLRVDGQFHGTLDKEKVIDTIPFQPIIFFIGPIPVVLVPKIDIIAGVHGTADVNFWFAGETSSTIKVGEKWTDPDDGGEGWKDINEFTPIAGHADGNFTADLTIEGYARANAKVLLYDAAGPGMGVRLGLLAEVHFGHKPLWKISGHLVADVNFSVDIGGILDVGDSSHTVLDVQGQIGQAPNQDPQCSFDSGPHQVEIGTPTTLGPRAGSLQGYFDCTDPEGDIPTYTAVSSNLNDGTNGAIPLRYSFQTGGIRTITITARDSDGGSKQFPIIIDVHNSLPIVSINAGSTVPAMVQFFMTAEAFDPDTNAFLACNRFSWSAPPDTVTVLNSGGTCNAVVRFSQVGIHTVTVTATDIYGGVGTKSISVNVTTAPSNFPPEWDDSAPIVHAYRGPIVFPNSCSGIFFTFCFAPDGSYLWNGVGAVAADEFEPPLYGSGVATDPEGSRVTYDWICKTGDQIIIHAEDQGDGTWKCTPTYATQNGIPIPVEIYAIASDGVMTSESRHNTYHFRARVN
jgi:hypothetical protein